MDFLPVVAWFVLGLAGLHLACKVDENQLEAPHYIWAVLTGPLLLFAVVLVIVTDACSGNGDKR